MSTPKCSRRDFLRAAGGGAAALAMPGRLPAADKPTKAKPNIIFIFTDDLGWGDLGCYGHPYMKTPNLDKLAKQGTRFSQFYVNSGVCSPSRTAFMTGHYPARHRVHGHFAKPQQNKARRMPNWLDPDVTTVTDLLKQAGYATGHFGKWHLGGGQGAPQPSAYGIDDHRTLTGGAPSWDQKEHTHFRADSTGLFVDETIRFIKANRNKPFYVNLWTLVPHATLKPTADELKVYEDLKADKKDFQSYMREYVAQAPDLNKQMKAYCASVTGMDKAIGRLMAALDKLGVSDNTLVFFTSDNGPEDYHIGNARNAGLGSPGPFRGRKRSMFEGGLRMPCIARWPGKIPPGRVDETSVMTGVDWLPTMCGIAGVKVPDIKPDGEDVSDMLMGKSRARKKPIMWEWRYGVAGEKAYRPPALAIRDGKWKLFVNPDGTGAQLYDIPADPQERKNLIKQHPDVAKRLTKQLLDWKKTLPK